MQDKEFFKSQRTKVLKKANFIYCQSFVSSMMYMTEGVSGQKNILFFYRYVVSIISSNT